MSGELRHSVRACRGIVTPCRAEAAVPWLHDAPQTFMRRPFAHLGCAAALAAVALAARPGVTSAFSDQSATPFKSRTSLVALTVTVQDPSARYITDLEPSDFAVYEDGVRQDVRFFQSESLPVDLIVLLDTSASMRGKVESVRDAAQAFLGTLRPGDRGAVVAFNERLQLVQPLTDDRDALSRALNSARASGFTALRNALYVSLKQFGAAVKGDDAIRRQTIAVLSDGEDTASVVSFDDVLSLARQTGVNVYTVRLRSSDDARRQTFVGVPEFFSEADFAMKTLARETGALAFSPTLSQLRRVYSSIAQEVASQYSIGYEPSGAAPGGAFHRVSVRVVTRPDLRARTRSGYSDDSGRGAQAAVR
jgi:Ca-activated chloride channel homolog